MIHSYTRHIASGLADMTLLLLASLLAIGWKVTRDAVSVREKQLYILMFLLYGMFRFLFAFCNSSYWYVLISTRMLITFKGVLRISYLGALLALLLYLPFLFLLYV